MKIISTLIIIVLVFPMSAGAEDKLLTTKTAGKLTMIAILLATALVVRMLINRDRKEVAQLHERLGAPDRSMEFQEGFDRWRLEWYGDQVYTLRNGVLYKHRLKQEGEVRGEK
jgi:hypothetical protein